MSNQVKAAVEDTDTSSKTVAQDDPKAKAAVDDTDTPDTPIVHQNPYLPGRKMSLRLANDVQIQASVMQCFTTTLSCTLLVEISDASLVELDWPMAGTNLVVVKVYDRRFSADLREEWGADAWTPAKERALRVFIAQPDGSGRQFLQELKDTNAKKEKKAAYKKYGLEYVEDDEDGDDEDEDEEWTDAELETYIQYWCEKLFRTEVDAYGWLESLQGTTLPTYYGAATVRLHSFGDPEDEALMQELEQNPYTTNAIMIEHVAGPSLTGLEEEHGASISEETYSNIIHSALDIIRSYHDHEVINYDVRPSNFIIEGGKDCTRVVMVDLTHAEARRQFGGVTDGEWYRAKSGWNEQAAIGCVFKMGMKRKYGVNIAWEYDEKFEGEWPADFVPDDELLRRARSR